MKPPRTEKDFAVGLTLLGGFLLGGLIFACVSCGVMSDHDWDATQRSIDHATKVAQAAAAAAGQGYAVPLIGAIGAGATALAGIWHSNSGLPGTKRRKYKLSEKGRL